MIGWLERASIRPNRDPVLELGGQVLPVVIRRLANAKRMTLRLAPDGSAVRVTLPQWGRTADALEFAGSRRDWLERQLAAIVPARVLGDGTALAFRGEALTIRHVPTAPRRPRVEDAMLVIGGPAQGLDKRLQRWLEGEAKRLLAADLAEYCTRAARAQPALALSRAQRRWGSCAHDGTIRINWRLVMAPDFVRRSVVAHEVAHLAHFDHSTAFHRELSRLFEGEVSAANSWLRRHGRGLYAPFG